MKSSFDLKGFIASKPWLVHLLLVLLVAASNLPYILANWAHFNFDDYSLIIENPTIRDFRNLPQVLASGRPIRGITFMIDYALFGLDPRGYHLDNVLWQLLATVLFYFLVFRLFGRRRLAAIAGCLFGFHPVHAEAVMAIAHRKELLAFCFIMLSFHAYLFRGRYPIRSGLFSLIFFILGLLSKQVVIVLPLLFFLHEWLGGKSLFERRLLARIMPLLAVGVILIAGGLLFWAPVFRDFNLFGRFSPVELREIGYSRVLATSFSAYPRHLQYLFFPVHLYPDHLVEVIDWSSPRAWLGLGVFLGLFSAAIGLRRDRAISFSMLWIFINLLPIMNWIPSNAFFAERYLYIPSAGACILVAALGERLYHSRERVLGERGYGAAAAAIVFLFLCLVMVAPISIRINYWWPKRELYYFDRAHALLISSVVLALAGTLVIAVINRGRPGRLLMKRPWLEFLVVYVLVSMLLLGAAFLVEGQVRKQWRLPEKDVDKTMVFASKWLARHAEPGPRPGSSMLFPSGSQAAEVGNLLFFTFGGSAAWVFILLRLKRRGRRVHPNQELAWAIMALIIFAMESEVVMRAGDWTSEVVLWRSTVMEEPRSLRGWNNLGKAYIDRRQYDRAIPAFKKAIGLKPEIPDTHRNLGMALLGTRDLRGAASAFERAIELSSGDLVSLLNLANILVLEAEQGIDERGYQKAIGFYLRILELDPRSAHARHNLAYCYFRLGALEKANQEVMKALSIDPKYRSALELKNRIQEAVKKGDR